MSPYTKTHSYSTPYPYTYVKTARSTGFIAPEKNTMVALVTQRIQPLNEMLAGWITIT